MSTRLCLVVLALLLLPLCTYADGCGFGKGFTPQLQETHQLAVISLTPSTADVSMFIAIEGIPAGKELTYVLPFWHRPDGFTLAEDDAHTFRKNCVDPAHEQVMRMQRIAARKGSNTLRRSGLYTGVAGIGGAFASPQVFGSSASTMLLPYQVQQTPHAQAELYKIGGSDFRQLIKQAGLPAKYAKPLAKYHTPYFAIMRLTGLPTAKGPGMSGKGVRYHFTHRLTNGHYTYPLGTGAAWPQPIPLTEVYLTCPDAYQLQVNAPVEGTLLPWRTFSDLFHGGISYLTESPAEQKKDMRYATEAGIREFLSPKTGLLLDGKPQYPTAWHIAYLQANPDEDIRVQISKRPWPLRLAIADFFARFGIGALTGLVLYLLAWLLTVRLVIRRRWLRAGSPGTLARHGWTTFCVAQIPAIFVILAMSALPILIAAGLSEAVILYMRKKDAKLYIRKKDADWRKWLTLTSWLCATGIFALMMTAVWGVVYWCETI